MSYYDWVSLGTLIGFALLAAMLLVPVYFFLLKEEEVSERHYSQRPGTPPDGDGAADETEPPK